MKHIMIAMLLLGMTSCTQKGPCGGRYDAKLDALSKHLGITMKLVDASDVAAADNDPDGLWQVHDAEENYTMQCYGIGATPDAAIADAYGICDAYFARLKEYKKKSQECCGDTR